MSRAIVVDLDDTLFDVTHRLPFAQEKRWPEFNEAHREDVPFEDVRSLIIELANCDYMIILISGRSEDHRKSTIDHLSKHSIPWDILLMRPSKDYTPDEILKPNLLEHYLASKEEVLKRVWFVLDDRDKVVEAWRNYGLRCWQVQAGRY